MQLNIFRLLTAAAIVALAALSPTPAAADPPPLPPAPPYIPGDVSPTSGSFSYPYNVIVVPPPATVDARGVNVTTNVDPGQSMTGMPGSALGNSAPPANSLTNSSALYGIAAGLTPALQPNPGVNIAAGNQATGLEDPSGRPPTNAPSPESAAPTSVPGNPPPVLESPDGTPPSTN